MNMTLLTETERDAARFANTINATVDCAEHLARCLNAAMAVFDLPDERLEALLNRVGAQNVQGLLALVAGLGAALNAGLPLMGRSTKAATEPKRQFTVDDTGHITVTPAS